MTTEFNQKVSDPGLTPVAGDHNTMDSESLYREREQLYRQSEQYASMQRLYPQLRLWMSRCQQSDLVSDSILDWDRSTAICDQRSWSSAGPGSGLTWCICGSAHRHK